MQILRLLAARRAASTVTGLPASECRDDEGPFFDLDLSSCPVRASSSTTSGSLSFSGSDSDSDDDERTELDFIISLQRSRSASPLKLCASEPPTRANSLQPQQHAARKRGIGSLRAMSFGARRAAPLSRGGRPGFAWASSGRHSFSSARSLRLFVDSPRHADQDEEHHGAAQSRRAPSRDVIRRCLARISRRLRTAASPRAAEARGLRRMRKCRSASSAAPSPSSATGRDDSVTENQDGIAGAIAHCKDSLHRASMSECDSPLLRSRSDPGKCEAA